MEAVLTNPDAGQTRAPSLRKIKVSINTKLLLVVVFFVLAPLSAYLYFAMDLFKKDKTAYIFDSTLATTSVLSRQVNESITEIINNSFLISGLIAQGEATQKYGVDIIDSQKDLIEFSIFSLMQPDPKTPARWAPSFSKIKEEKLKEFKISQDYFDNLRKNFTVPELIIKGQKMVILNQSEKEGIPHLALYLAVDEQKIILVRLGLDGLFKIFNENKAFQNMLISDSGEVLVHRDPKLVLAKTNLAKSPQVQATLKQELNSGVQELENAKGEQVLMAYTKIPSLRMVVISEILKEQAFLSIKDLLFKSFVLALCLMALAFMVALVVSRSFTGPIRVLMGGTQELAHGNFQTELEIKASDEIGVLSDSFNYMASEIRRYMAEVKEKARMENELAVAQLVQSSFFPDASLKFPGLEIYGYYKPASECGGDWYGILPVGDRTLMFIGDATGHGVPAALITATVNAAMNLVEEMCKMNSKLADSPSLIMRLLNKAVHDVGGQILMTFFFAVYNRTTKELHFANASHNPPYLLRHNPNGQTKDDVEVLEVPPGPRLGHQAQAVYHANKITLKTGDLLILTTDGILEGENPEAKQFGERRFIKSLLSVSSQSSQEIVEKLLADAATFYEGVTPNDDVTLVVAKTV